MSNREGHPAIEPSGLKFHDTVAHLIAKGLNRHGVDLVFGQSLPSLLHMASAQIGIRQIGYRTENAGGYMADAYARITGRVAIVTAQNGPAATLLVPPLAEALKASIPIVALLQEVNRNQTDRNAFQEFDHLALFSSCSKWVRRVTEASRVEDYLDQAMMNACSGRPGPAVLLLPADLLSETAPACVRHANLGHFPLDRTVANDESITQAAELIRSAKAPIMIAGVGIHISGAAQMLTTLQEDTHLPVATTTMGKGAVDERHPLSIGVVGSFMGVNSATRHQRSLITDADVVVLVGNRTNQNGTDSWTLYPQNAHFIHIDVDGTEIGRNYEALRLVGDARETLKALHQVLISGDLSQRQANRAALEQRIADGREAYFKESLSVRQSDARTVQPNQPNQPNQPIRPERIMHEIDQRLTADTIVVADASYSSTWVANFLTSLQPGMRFLTPRGLAGIGWGFPMALGAKLARPTSPVICVVGDGGFGHVWSELETAIRENIKIVLIVLNNGILGFQKHAENVKFGDHTTAVDFAPVDHAAIARACGCRGIRIEDPALFGPALDVALNETPDDAVAANQTTVIEVICDPDAFPPLTIFTSCLESKP